MISLNYSISDDSWTGRHLLSFLVMILMSAGAGCDNSPNREISGMVTLDGRPLESGDILFKSLQGSTGPTTGSMIVDGAYRIPAVAQGVLAGNEYRVEIISMVGKGRMAPNPEAPGGQLELLENILPERYNVQSELRVKISSDPNENTFDFDLTTSADAR